MLGHLEGDRLAWAAGTGPSWFSSLKRQFRSTSGKPDSGSKTQRKERKTSKDRNGLSLVKEISRFFILRLHEGELTGGSLEMALG